MAFSFDKYLLVDLITLLYIIHNGLLKLNIDVAMENRPPSADAATF